MSRLCSLVLFLLLVFAWPWPLDCAVLFLLLREEPSSAAEDGVHLAHAKTAALALFATDTLSVPNHNCEEDCHHREVKNENAGARKETEAAKSH